MGNKEEFTNLYAVAMAEFKQNIEYLQNVEDEINQQKEMLKTLNAIDECDDYTREKLNIIYSKLNAINKKMRLIRKEKEAKKQRLDPYFKLFDFPNEEYIQTIIELNNLLKKHQPVIGKQIIKCLNYLNDRGIDIVL